LVIPFIRFSLCFGLIISTNCPEFFDTYHLVGISRFGD
jgi:hypothetical protein